MDHARFRSTHTAATYVSGDLDERTQQSFELHMMECPACVEDVEIWRAMQVGLRAQGAVELPSSTRESGAARWRLAASLAVIAVGSGSVGWFGRSIAEPTLTDDALAMFNMPPITRGDECTRLPTDDATQLLALRVPGAVSGWQLELVRGDGTVVDPSHYGVRTQLDGSWLVRLRARALAGEILHLQTRDADGATEPVGCIEVRT
jgi:anti-sigma factor RsiW